jgi:hypothetical protein
MVHRNGWCIYSGGPEEDTTVSTSDRTLDSITIQSEYWKVGKRITVVAPVLMMRSGPLGTTYSVIAKLYIGSTLVMDATMTLAAGADPRERNGHYEFEMSFVVGAVAASGVTLYPTRNSRSFTNLGAGSFGTPVPPGNITFYPMYPAVPGLAIDTTVDQTIAVKYACGQLGGGVDVLLQGLTAYAT